MFKFWVYVNKTNPLRLGKLDIVDVQYAENEVRLIY